MASSGEDTTRMRVVVEMAVMVVVVVGAGVGAKVTVVAVGRRAVRRRAATRAAALIVHTHAGERVPLERTVNIKTEHLHIFKH